MTTSLDRTGADVAAPAPAAIAALGLGALAIGISELVAIGVIDGLGADLGVSRSAAGWIVGAYAAGVCVGGPVLAARTAGSDPRRVLCGAVAGFVVCSALTVAAPTLMVLLVLRLLAGALHGLYVGTATAHAAHLAAPERRGQAVATVFGGIAVASVIGAPLGVALGTTVGWRWAFVAVTAASLVAWCAIARWVPGGATTRAEPATVPGAAMRAILRTRVLLTLAVIVPLLGGVFTLYTFVTAYLADVTRVPSGSVGAILLGFGAAGAIGTIGGGRLADRSPWRTVGACSVAVTATLALLAVAGPRPILTTALLVLCGLTAFGFVPAYQLCVMSLVPGATELAATLGSSAANAGIVLGSLAGGLALHGTGADGLAPTGAALCALAAALALVAGRSVRRSAEVTR